MRSFILITTILNFLIILHEITSNKTSASLANTKLHTIQLNNDLKLSWLINWNKNEVMFNVNNAFKNGNKWFSFGFSKRGKIENSDICFFHKDNFIFNSPIDTHINENKLIEKDLQQDCELLRIEENSVAFKRKIDTCDPQDFKMHEGTMYILWGFHFDNEFPTIYSFPKDKENDDKDKELRERDNNIHKHKMGSDNGMIMAQLLRADKLYIPEKNIRHVEVTLSKVPVPAQETLYWCHIQKFDDFIKKKHHIVQFEPIISNTAVVHHMEIFHCETDVNVQIPSYDGDCDNLPAEAKVCSRVISLWAMGASAFTYPMEAGLPIGGKNYNPYIRLEVHFNNPNLIDGLIDSSGMRIKIISELRKYDAAIMELGLEYTDKMAIPPGIIAYPLSGYCIAECTEMALPKHGITIFGSQLHTHLRGARVITRHFRNGEELKEINKDDYYSTHFQEIRTLRYKPTVLPGDAMVTTCYYDTEEYTNTTLGGFSISDEMCVNYIQYYPATKLEVCKSSVSEDNLAFFFNYMYYKENQKRIVLMDGARSENYRSIEWTQSRIDQLYIMYTQEALSMQCNQSNGQRFDGYNWEGAPITPVKLQLPQYPSDQCEYYNLYQMTPLEQGRCGYLGECIY